MSHPMQARSGGLVPTSATLTNRARSITGETKSNKTHTDSMRTRSMGPVLPALSVVALAPLAPAVAPPAADDSHAVQEDDNEDVALNHVVDTAAQNDDVADEDAYDGDVAGWSPQAGYMQDVDNVDHAIRDIGEEIGRHSGQPLIDEEAKVGEDDEDGDEDVYRDKLTEELEAKGEDLRKLRDEESDDSLDSDCSPDADGECGRITHAGDHKRKTGEKTAPPVTTAAAGSAASAPTATATATNASEAPLPPDVIAFRQRMSIYLRDDGVYDIDLPLARAEAERREREAKEDAEFLKKYSHLLHADSDEETDAEAT